MRSAIERTFWSNKPAIVTTIFGLLISLCWFVGSRSVLGQESHDDLTSAVRSLNKSFDEYVAEYELLARTYNRISTVFQETEKELATIQDQTFRNQLSLMKSMIEKQELGLSNDDVVRGLRLTMPTPEQLVATSNWWNQARTINQLNSLSAAQQTVAKRRLEAFEDFRKLQNDLTNWTKRWTDFWPKYWRLTDVDDANQAESNNAVLAELAQMKSPNLHARLAMGLLHLRMGNDDSARESFTSVAKERTPLKPISIAALAWLDSLQGKHGTAKRLGKLLSQDDCKNPYVQWIMAQIQISEGNVTGAARILEKVAVSEELANVAQKQQVVLGSIGGKLSPSTRTKNLKLAEVVEASASPDDWHAKLLHAMAFSAADKTAEGIDLAMKSLEAAKGDQKDVCEAVIKSIKSKQPLEWNFLRHRSNLQPEKP